jgi:hypothetical protein
MCLDLVISWDFFETLPDIFPENFLIVADDLNLGFGQIIATLR